MGIKQLYNDNLRKLPNEYGDVSVMVSSETFSGIYFWEYFFLMNISLSKFRNLALKPDMGGNLC